MTKSLINKKILLVGSKGLVGGEFLNQYRNKYEIDRFDKNNINELYKTLGKEYDFLIYLALSQDYKSKVFSHDIMYVHIELLRKILEISINKIMNVIYFSTGSVYKKDRKELTEDSDIDYSSKNPYVLSKIIAEMILSSFSDFYKSIYIVRPFYIYGKKQNQNMLMKELINKIIKEEAITINKNGGLLFNPIHVKDVVRFIDQIIDYNDLGVNAYNFCGDEIISLENLIITLGNLCKKKPIIKYNTSDIDYCVASKKKYFKCEVSLNEGLTSLI